MAIMVVDDEAGIRSLMSDALTKRGHRVITAENGVQAVELVLKQQVDVVFLDIRMPGGDGLTALREIRVQRPSIPIVMITGCGEMSAVDESIETGSLLCLAKPFSMRDVIGVLDMIEAGSLVASSDRSVAV